MRRAIIAALVAISIAGCGLSSKADQSAPLPNGEPTKVVATAFPLFEVVGLVGGERVHASNLFSTDPFAVTSLTADQQKSLDEADLVVTLGQGVQPAVDAALVGHKGPVLRVLDGLPALPSPANGSVDPYVWTDPNLMERITWSLQSTLREIDEGGAKTFGRNATTYARSMADLDEDFREDLAVCQHHDIVTEVPAFQYLAARYGLRQVPVDGALAEGPGSLKAAVEATHPTTVYARTLPSLTEADRLQGELKVRVAVLDDAAVQPDQARRAGSGYITVMGLNLDAIQIGLGCNEGENAK